MVFSCDKTVFSKHLLLGSQVPGDSFNIVGSMQTHGESKYNIFTLVPRKFVLVSFVNDIHIV